MSRFFLPLMALALSCGRIGFDALDLASQEQDATLAQDAPDPCLPAPGLLGHWTLNAADVQGAMVLDRSGNDYHGTLMGVPAPQVTAGNKGEALDYAGTTTAYVGLPPMPVDENMGAFNTVALWFYHADPNADESPFYMPPGPGAGPPRYDLWLNTDRIAQPTLCINGGTGDCWGYSGPELIGQWVHVVAVFANGPTTGSRLYLNGVSVPMDCRFGTCDEIRTAQNPVTIGANDSTYAWHGRIDDVQLFNRALDDGEIAALFTCAQ